MTQKPDNPPAFPHANPDYDGNWDQRKLIEGMRLRDFFAASALMGPIADLHGTAEEHAAIAYEYADAMLAERAKSNA